MDDEALAQLLGLEAEALGYPDLEVPITPELERTLDAYSGALEEALRGFVAQESRWPPEQVEDFVDQLMDEGRAPLNVLLTLRGEGAGIWDGRWDPYFTPDELRRLQTLLVRRLGSYADPSGGGILNDAMRNAILEAAGEAAPSNGHTGAGWFAPNASIQNAQIAELVEYWHFDHRRPPQDLSNVESYVQALKFVLGERPRRLDAVQRDVRKFGPQQFDNMGYEFMIDNLEEAGVIETYPSPKRPTIYYIRRAPAGLRKNRGPDAIVRQFGRETGIIPRSAAANEFLRDEAHLDYDEYYRAYVPFEDEVDDVVLAMRMRNLDVEEKSRPASGHMLLRPPPRANRRSRMRRNNDAMADVVIGRAGDVAKIVPRSEAADTYIAERLLVGDTYDERLGGYTASFADLNEIVATLEAAHFDVVVQQDAASA